MEKRNKSLPYILAAVATVSLATVGFASWIVGYQKYTTSYDTIVKCETVKWHYADLHAEIKTPSEKELKNVLKQQGQSAEKPTNRIVLGGINTDITDNPNGIYNLNGNNKIDFYLNVKLKISDSFMFDTDNGNGVPTYISLNYNDNIGAPSSGLFVVNDTNKLIQRDSSVAEWHYLDLPDYESQTINGEQNPLILDVQKSDFTNLVNDNDSIVTNNGWTIKMISSEQELYLVEKLAIHVTFRWGNFFGNTDPATYYNSLKSNFKTEEELKTFYDNVFEELSAMKEQCNSNDKEQKIVNLQAKMHFQNEVTA